MEDKQERQGQTVPLSREQIVELIRAESQQRPLVEDLEEHRKFIERAYTHFMADAKTFCLVGGSLLIVVVGLFSYLGSKAVAIEAAKELARSTITEKLDNRELDKQIDQLLNAHLEVFKEGALSLPNRLWTVHGHENLFREFRELVDSVPRDEREHAIYTINSQVYGGEAGIGGNWDPDGAYESWDDFIDRHVCRRRGIHFYRVTIFPDPTLYGEEEAEVRRWVALRKRLLEEKFSKTPNYHQFFTTGPQSIEMFLVDDREMVMSIPVDFPEREAFAKISFGVRIRNRELGQELQRLHVNVLQKQAVVPRWNEGGNG